MNLNYSDKLLKYFRNPQHVGSLDSSDPFVKTATAGSKSAGDFIQLQIQLNQQDTIERAVFRAYGSGPLIAVAEFVASSIEGEKLSEISIDSQFIINELGLPEEKHSCGILGADVLVSLTLL